MGNIYRRANKR